METILLTREPLHGFKLCPRPELTLILFPTLHVGGRAYEPDALLKLREAGRQKLVCAMIDESGRALPSRPPLPFLQLDEKQLDPAHVVSLLERLREVA